MLFRLILAGRDVNAYPIHSGYVMKWHKSEGEWFDYGDDLCDLVVQEVKVPRGVAAVRARRRWLNEQPGQMADIADRLLRGGRLSMPDPDPDSLVPVRLEGAGYLMRLTSSESGVVRRICARDRERRQAGSLLAILGTDGSEAIDEASDGFQQASICRVVENFIPWPAVPERSPPT